MDIDWNALERELDYRDYQKAHSAEHLAEVAYSNFEVWCFVKGKEAKYKDFCEFAKNAQVTMGKPMDRLVILKVLEKQFGMTIENGKAVAIK